MKYSWRILSQFIDLSDLQPQTVVDVLTAKAFEVEDLRIYPPIPAGVIVGRVIELEDHPKSDHLHLTVVDVGREKLNIVCGAQNLSIGDYVPVATLGTTLPNGMVIEERAIRGKKSFGMLCSKAELKLAEDAEGIWLLPRDVDLGSPISALVEDDVVLDVKTLNRGDALSHIGLARELSTLFHRPFKRDAFEKKDLIENVQQVKHPKLSADPTFCDWYRGIVVTELSLKETPMWMSLRLERLGIRSIHPLVDLSNYVMLEFGQPTHFFDFGRMGGDEIQVRPAIAGEKMTTIDGLDISFVGTEWLIASDTKPLAIAGVMGSADSAVVEDTRAVFIEIAHFDPATVRRAAYHTGLRTQASQRFERGVWPQLIPVASNRIIGLLEEMYGKPLHITGWVEHKVPGIAQETPRSISITADAISHITGITIPEQQITDIITSLHATVTSDAPSSWSVIPPAWRYDLTDAPELVEDLIRIYGLEHLQPIEMEGVRQPIDHHVTTIKHDLKNALVARGFYELLTYSFVSDADDRWFRPSDRSPIHLFNPVNKEQPQLRTSLLPLLLHALSDQSRNTLHTPVFEWGQVFSATTPTIPAHDLALIGWHEGVTVDEMKAHIAALLRVRDVDAPLIARPFDIPALHPFRSAKLSIALDGKEVELGYVGELHPDAMNHFGFMHRVVVASLRVEAFRQLPQGHLYIPYSPYPIVRRDISFIVDSQTTFAQIDQIVRKAGSSLVVTVEMFDAYAEGLPPGKKSVAYHLSYQSKDRTLTDTEVETIHSAIAKALSQELGAQIRE